MPKKKPTKKVSKSEQELDSTYILKLVLYLIIGSQWLRITKGDTTQLPIPVGFIIGLLFASHDHFQIDRKIEYALLLVAMFIGFWLPLGINIVVSN